MTKAEFEKIIFELNIDGDKQHLAFETFDEFAELLPTEATKRFKYFLENGKRISITYIKSLVKCLLMDADRCTACLSPLWIDQNKSNDPYLCKSHRAKYDEHYSTVLRFEKKPINKDDPYIKGLNKIRQKYLKPINESHF